MSYLHLNTLELTQKRKNVGIIGTGENSQIESLKIRKPTKKVKRHLCVVIKLANKQGKFDKWWLYSV